MVFQDGGRHYQDFVPTVFDNLVAAGDMPPTVGVFLDPGVFADTTVSNRSLEDDTLSDQYARFLLDEIVPEVERVQPLRDAAAGRAIWGLSSGGICAFTVAWQRPDRFHKVLSHVGSFTNIASGPTLREGGHNYPSLLRRVHPSRSASTCRTARTTSRRPPAIGGWPTCRWTTRCAAPATTPRSSPARASTRSRTAARSSPTHCGGSGAASCGGLYWLQINRGSVFGGV